MTEDPKRNKWGDIG